eukprot:1744043-Prymnesium_polylepis.1
MTFQSFFYDNCQFTFHAYGFTEFGEHIRPKTREWGPLLWEAPAVIISAAVGRVWYRVLNVPDSCLSIACARCGACAVSLCCEHTREARRPPRPRVLDANPETPPGSLSDTHHAIITACAGSSTLPSSSSPSSSSPCSGVEPARHPRRLLLTAAGPVAFVGSRHPTEDVASLARAGDPD